MAEFGSFDQLDADLLIAMRDVEIFYKGSRGAYLSEITQLCDTPKPTVLYRLKRLVDVGLATRDDDSKPEYRATDDGKRFALLWKRSET